MGPEGWYIDPFGQHEQRWFSDGRPTSLVRDGRTEGHAEPPADSYSGPLTEPPEGVFDGSDLKRADDLESVENTDIIEHVNEAGLRVGLNPWDGPL